MCTIANKKKDRQSTKHYTKKNTEQHEHNKTKLMKTTTTKTKAKNKLSGGWADFRSSLLFK
jgi:ribosomal protein S17E